MLNKLAIIWIFKIYLYIFANMLSSNNKESRLSLTKKVMFSMKIRNFTFKEFVDTQTGIENVPKSFYYVANIIKLANYLQTIRDSFGKPIIINSGFRSPEVNQAVGGVPTSNHMYGIAADVTCARSFFPELCEILQAEKEKGYLKELIIYPKKQFIHLAIHPCDYGK